MIEEYRIQCLKAKRSKRLKSKRVVFAVLKKVIALSCITGVVIISNLPLLDAYEAHIINVTAEIHKLDDPIFNPTSMSFCVMEEGVNVTSTDPDNGPVIVHYEIGVGTLNPDLVLDPDCNSPAGAGDPSVAHIDITQQDTVIKAVTCTADGLHKGRVVYETYHFDLDLCPVVCGNCEGKVSGLTLKYNGSQPDLIRVVQKKDSGIVFESMVAPNEQFSFVGTVNGTLSTEITIYVDEIENTKIHTSCSELVGPNMVFGDFTIIAGESSVGGPLCPVFGDIVLNEFLPDPDGEEYGFDFGDDSDYMPQGEWIEIYNNSDNSFDLAGWYIRNSLESDANKIVITNLNTVPASTVIGAKNWLVVYMNKAILNNMGDTVRLFDNSNRLIDLYVYTTDSDYCDIEPTPGDDNSTDTFGSCAGVPPNKSYARIPDGTDDWVDPIPTPGTPNKVEDLADSDLESINNVNSVSSAVVNLPVESAPGTDDADSENLNDDLSGETKDESLIDITDDSESPVDDNSDDSEKDNEVIAKDEELAETASENEADTDTDTDDLEEDINNETKSEDLIAADDDNNKDSEDDDSSDDDEVIIKDEESIESTETEGDEEIDNNNSNPDKSELETETNLEDDLDEEDAAVNLTENNSAEEIADDMAMADTDESEVDDSDDESLQAEDDEAVDGGNNNDDNGDGGLPITPDEEAVISFNLNI